MSGTLRRLGFSMKKLRLLIVLIAVASLLGLRTGYACAYMGQALVSTCCCKDDSARCPMRQKCADGDMSQEAPCCITVVTAGAGVPDQQPLTAEQSAKLDLPALPAATQLPVASSIVIVIAAMPIASAAVANGSLTWLRTGRLRL